MPADASGGAGGGGGGQTQGMRALVLASTSPHRRQLLARLRLPFSCAAPNVDETPILGEPPEARALRLAEEKARAVRAEHPDAVIIGGDQTIADGDMLFDKPGDADNAIRQLRAMRGRDLRFFTAVAVLDATSGDLRAELTAHAATMRDDSDNAEIERYVRKEAALDCAGGAQIEGLGISLMADIQGGDPTALIGMSLIAVAKFLRERGFIVP